MKVMVIVRATKNSEAGIMPGEKLLTEMGTYNEELVKAGWNENGKVQLYDGRTGEAFKQETAVGYMYMLKLDHMVENLLNDQLAKIHFLCFQNQRADGAFAPRPCPAFLLFFPCPLLS